MENTPRVNSARLGDYVGRTVRLVGEVKRVKDLSAIVQATDMGQVEVKLTTKGDIESVESSFIEVIGTVEDANVMKLHGCINFGQCDLDLDLINFCINLSHDPKFAKIF
ncbi:hypothetical protein EW145_g668 [Phellinidium pouzarii]|uniref:Replication factor A protein 3 n=1 Tax=Phellinidium pouzarii TaxID=167371 RepID=A0A4S4LN09_9AGAM|nr:hypothetical protein EW145_g668 [Phellinidium pouzarii]